MPKVLMLSNQPRDSCEWAVCQRRSRGDSLYLSLVCASARACSGCVWSGMQGRNSRRMRPRPLLRY
eukprot:6212116-Pleurochrysis_carterae.AAC.2